MIWLILGVALWWGAHLLKRVAPNARASLEKRGNMIVAMAIFVSVALMIVGYRAAPFLPVYTPLSGIGHLNNLLMLIAVYLFGAGKTKGLLSDKLRDPMLLGMLVFAVAHLLVNGDMASVILFGGLGLWAIVEMVVINRAQGAWQRPPAGHLKGDLRNLVATIVIYGLIAAIHIWSGHNPFLGTYG